MLIVEDIIDTGYTLEKVRGILNLRDPASLAICTLLDKPSRREVEVPVEWIGFSIPDEFVVGYGIDYAQRYRNSRLYWQSGYRRIIYFSIKKSGQNSQ